MHYPPLFIFVVVQYAFHRVWYILQLTLPYCQWLCLTVVLKEMWHSSCWYFTKEIHTSRVFSRFYIWLVNSPVICVSACFMQYHVFLECPYRFMIYSAVDFALLLVTLLDCSLLILKEMWHISSWHITKEIHTFQVFNGCYIWHVNSPVIHVSACFR